MPGKHISESKYYNKIFKDIIGSKKTTGYKFVKNPLNGTESWMFYTNVPKGNWTVAMLVAKNEVSETVNKMLLTLLLISLASLILIEVLVCARKKAEEALKESQRALYTLLSNLPGMAYRCANDENFTLEWVSEGCLDLTGYPPTEIEHYKTSYSQLIKPEDREHVWNTIQNALKESRPFTIEYRIITADGKEKWVWEQGREVKSIEGGLPVLEGFITDITERKKAEEQLKSSLKEKEMLLKEIHHRVKNNLQVITSLLNLQSQYIKDKKTADIFKESQNRIKTMALIHEKLYQSKDLARIDFSEYISNLTRYLFQSYGVNASIIDLKINVDNVLLDVDMAIPCGLIINELISNSLKYAFPPGEKGEIGIDFNTKNNKFILIVWDNGIGIPDNIDFQNTESLGLQLVCILTEQLGGTIELNKSLGTKFKITFPVDSAIS